MVVLTGASSLWQLKPTLLEALRPEAARPTPEGLYANLLALPPAHQALLAVDAGGSPAITLLLDEHFEDRVCTARRIWHALVRKKPVKAATFTAQRRRRLKLALRALDANLADIGYRDIARALFGARVPPGAEWRTHALRSLTIRLVKDGRALMQGGYLGLLRPDHRTG